jgi:DNA replication protein DnaC
MVMEQSVFDRIEQCCSVLKVDLSSTEAASYAEKHNLSQEQLSAMDMLFEFLAEKKQRTCVETLLRLSRLPVKAPKTFENYDFSRLHGKDAATISNLPSLSEVHSGKNIALIGPPGVGKTHLAEDYGRACCLEGMKAYFLKASELKAKYVTARKFGREANMINGLMKYSCLIIDEIGRCTFDRESTALFFDMIDRWYGKEGSKCMIFTSNKQPSEWFEFFRCDDDLKAALDRLFDDAKVIIFKGDSYRGRKREVLAVETGPIPSNARIGGNQ